MLFDRMKRMQRILRSEENSVDFDSDGRIASAKRSEDKEHKAINTVIMLNELK